MNSQINYAGFWLRVGASIIDAVILLIINILVGLFFSLLLNFLYSSHLISVGRLFILFMPILYLIPFWFYSSLFESSSHQATLGKMAVGIKVTDLSGNRISFARATGRFFSRFISVVIIFIGFIMVAFTEKKQALHDIIAGTLVVKK